MHLIETQKELEETISIFKQCDFIVVDTEFMRENKFWPQLCLIQIASRQNYALIDPLSSTLNLAPVLDLMKDKKIMKVFHAARQDLEIFFHLGGFVPSPFFDTQIAAMACGFGEDVSYDHLVHAITGKHLDKSLRFTNWSQRPLSDKQKEYALSDVTCLIPVYDYLIDELERNNRLEWLDKEIEILSSSQTYDLSPHQAWRRVGIATKNRRDFSVLCAVAAWREEEAQKKNIPRSRIMKDYILQEICRQKPKNSHDLKQIRSLPAKWENSIEASRLLESINKALSIPEQELSPPPPIMRTSSSKYSARTELLIVFLRLVCEKEKISPRLVAHTAELEQLVLKGEKAPIAALKGWRYDLFGKKALQILQGDIAFRLEKNKIVFFENKSLD